MSLLTLPRLHGISAACFPQRHHSDGHLHRSVSNDRTVYREVRRYSIFIIETWRRRGGDEVVASQPSRTRWHFCRGESGGWAWKTDIKVRQQGTFLLNNFFHIHKILKSRDFFHLSLKYRYLFYLSSRLFLTVWGFGDFGEFRRLGGS